MSYLQHPVRILLRLEKKLSGSNPNFQIKHVETGTFKLCTNKCFVRILCVRWDFHHIKLWHTWSNYHVIKSSRRSNKYEYNLVWSTWLLDFSTLYLENLIENIWNLDIEMDQKCLQKAFSEMFNSVFDPLNVRFIWT